MIQPLNILLYEPSIASTAGAFVEDIGGRIASYEHSIAATYGFERMSVALACSPAEGLRWLQRLMTSVEVWGPDADRVWEGYLSSVTLTIGGRARSVSVDPVANRVRVRYELRGLGTPQVTASASTAASVALYGTKDAVISTGVPTDSTAATALRDAYLAARAYPTAVPQTTIAAGAGGSGGGAALTLEFTGWYATLGWVLTERTDTTTETTTTQVGALIGTASPGIGATNPYLSTSTADIASSGVSDTRQIAADTSYQAKIEALLAKGTSAGQRLAWGVYERRRFRVTTWAGATPTTITYRIRDDGIVTTDGGAPVRPWRVRPDAMVQDPAFSLPGTRAGVDTAGRFYVERVAFRMDDSGYQITLEPPQSDGVDARIARLS